MFTLRDFRLLATARYVAKKTADSLFPPRCYVCLEENTWLCIECAKILPIHFLACVVCGKPHPRGLTCLPCRTQTALHGAVSSASYQSKPMARAVGWLKFKGVRPLAPVLAQRLLPYLLAIDSVENLRSSALFIPLPLHRSRQRQRGFNQSYDIAQALHNFTGIPLFDGLERSRVTFTQRELPAELRRQNVAHAFTLAQSLPEKQRYLLIDDVTTTGSTLSAAAKALRVKPNQQIWGVTVARD